MRNSNVKKSYSSMYDLCNSLQFTESLELVGLLAQELELVEKSK